MGVVYLATDTDERFRQRRVAVKEMSKAGFSLERAREAEAAFAGEASILIDLLHPNLPRVYDYFSEGECCYLVMDYIEGSTLAGMLEQAGGGPLPLTLVLGWAVELCDVLHYLHTCQPPVIFRDIKPANVMVSTSGHLFLIDFGIARLFKPGQAHDTVPFGSVGYAAPEQYGNAQSEPRSDVYGLGALLHQLLTGLDPSEHPFFFRPVSQVNPAVPAELELLLMQMVEMDRERRPASIRDVWNVLEQVRFSVQTRGAALATGTRVRAAPGTIIARYDRHTAPLWSLAWSPNGKHIASIGGEGHLRVWNATSGRTRFTGRGFYEKLQYVAWAPDNSYIIAAGGQMQRFHAWNARNCQSIFLSGGDGPRQPITALAFSPADATRVASGLDLFPSIALWSVFCECARVTKRYEGHSKWDDDGFGIQCLAWSPDGTHIASAADDTHAVHVWDPDADLNYPDPLLYLAHHAPVLALTWSPDSTRIVSADRQGSIEVWEAATGNPILTYSGHQARVRSLTWSPDGTRIASAGEDGTVQTWEAGTGAHHFTYHGHTGTVHAVAWSPDGTLLASGGDEGTVQVWLP